MQDNLKYYIRLWREVTGENWVAPTVTGYPRRFELTDDPTTTDGENFSARAAIEFAVMGANEILRQSVFAAQGRAEAAAKVFPEYVREILTVPPPAIGTYLETLRNNEWYLDLPEDFGWVIAGIFGLMIDSPLSLKEYDIVFEAPYRYRHKISGPDAPETSDQPVGFIEGGSSSGTTRLIIACHVDRILKMGQSYSPYCRLIYLACQKPLEAGTQDDILMRRSNAPQIVAAMKKFADAFKQSLTGVA